jgi:uncharacterized linocin/CFP29 family protein
MAAVLGRDALGWSPDLWNRLDQAAHAEFQRTGVASRFIPLHGPLPGATNVPAGVVDPGSMTVSEEALVPLVELWVDFALTEQQVAGEEQLGTALGLVTRAANLLAQAEDALVFQGERAKVLPLFESVQSRAAAGRGLAEASRETLNAGSNGSGATIFAAVVRAQALLQARGHQGPYALALPPAEYAETFDPLPGNGALAADRIAALASLYAASALPASTGLLVSTGGDTVDIAVGLDPTTAFTHVDADGLYRFRLVERFALRLKDASAVVEIRFGD